MPNDPPSQSYGVASGHFWRNVTLIALAHVAVLLGLIRWSVEARSSSDAQSIVWISGAENLAAGEPESSASPPPVTPKAFGATPPLEPEPLKPDKAEKEEPLLTAAKSEIELPTATPTSAPRPTPTPTAKPKAMPKQTPRPTPKSVPKKAVLAKASPKPSPKAKSSRTKSAETKEPSAAKSEKKKIVKTAPASEGSASQTGNAKPGSAGKVGHAAGSSSASEFGWYGNMLHDRFYSAWIQPTTNIASGAKISTLVRVRIERDGRVSKFEIIKPSENVVVNESVGAIAKRVTEVDPPPAGLANGDHYDIKINFELNTDQGTANP
jgi:outer membrane biosynthesis protein TonB